jgi:hypothetical protein
MDGVGGCHDTLKASEGEIIKKDEIRLHPSLRSTKKKKEKKKDDARNARHHGRNPDIST